MGDLNYYPSLQKHILFRRTFSLFSTLILPLSFVSAAAFVSVYNAAYTTINENYLIIQGGGIFMNASLTIKTSQFIALNLTVATWDVTNPPWIILNVNPPLPPLFTTSGHSMTASKNGSYVTIWTSGGLGNVVEYKFLYETWTLWPELAELKASDNGLKAATDLETGIFYLPSGYNKTDMYVFDPNNPTPGPIAAGPAPRVGSTLDGNSPLGVGHPGHVPMPNGYDVGVSGYTWVYSAYRKSFILFGGTGGVGPYLHEYRIAEKAWFPLVRLKSERG